MQSYNEMKLEVACALLMHDTWTKGSFDLRIQKAPGRHKVTLYKKGFEVETQTVDNFHSIFDTLWVETNQILEIAQRAQCFVNSIFDTSVPLDLRERLFQGLNHDLLWDPQIPHLLTCPHKDKTEALVWADRLKCAAVTTFLQQPHPAIQNLLDSLEASLRPFVTTGLGTDLPNLSKRFPA